MHVHEDINFICLPFLSSKSFPMRCCVTIKSIVNNIFAFVYFGNPLVILAVMLLQYYCIRRRIFNCTSSHLLPLKHIKRLMIMQFFLLSLQMSLAKQFILYQLHSHQMRRLQNLKFNPMITISFASFYMMSLKKAIQMKNLYGCKTAQLPKEYIFM